MQKSKRGKKPINKQRNSQTIDQTGNLTTFKLDETPYEYPRDVFTILGEFKKARKVYAKRDKDLGNIYYYNIPCSLDTETSSFYIHNGNVVTNEVVLKQRHEIEEKIKDTKDPKKRKALKTSLLDGEKCATMYVWMFSINGKVILGRTWDQFEDMMRRVQMYTDLNTRLIVYVHNMGFDFAFFCRRMKWYKTFCIKVREPIYAITEGGIEFRDSYILTNKSLDESAKDLLKYKVRKLKGSLDYKLIRGSRTPLTEQEKAYCVHDCLVLDAIIQEKIEQEGAIHKIPLTNTGYVRRFLKSKCYPASGSHSEKGLKKETKKYKELMSQLTLEPEEYDVLKRAFMGGFTHANALWVREELQGRVDSFDFTSSYPAVILSEMFPMSKAEHFHDVSRETFKNILKNKLSIFDITLINPRTKDGIADHYLSESKCLITIEVDGVKYNWPSKKIPTGKVKIDNGRIASVQGKLTTTITNVDFEIIMNVYDCDSFIIGDMLVYEKGYLPKPIIEGVLELYKAKTELKGVESEDGSAELNYMVKKGMLNSVYGCMVTDIVKELTEYVDNRWDITKPDLEDSISKYNNSKTRFLYYPWGVFVTAYARRNLWMGILEFGQDYIYSDTDSIKCLNVTKHLQFITWYNNLITFKVEKVLEYYGIDKAEASPKTVKGVPKPIGVWDWETEKHEYRTFKTLGSKRYAYTQDEVDKEGNLHKDVFHITVAGLGKKSGAEYIGSKEQPFEFFSDEMSIPAENTGKLLHTYIDGEMSGTFEDYLGQPQEFHELSGIHLEPTYYTLSLEKGFKAYLDGLREGDTKNYGYC